MSKIKKVKKINKIYLGKILDAWGLKGNLIIKSYCKIPNDIEKYNPILIQGILKEKNLKIIKKKKHP